MLFRSAPDLPLVAVGRGSNLVVSDAGFDGIVVVLEGAFEAVEIDDLAAHCVKLFDAYRAPMLPEERAQRVAQGLTRGQLGHLDRWGYPFLFEDFQFHMTLTGRLPPSQRGEILQTLERAFADQGAVWSQWRCALEPLARPDAAARIADRVLSLAEKSVTSRGRGSAVAVSA